MLASDVFLLRHRPFHQELIPMLIDPLSEEQFRAWPHARATPIAWHLWHMARAEDVGVNRLATDGTQLLYDDDWQDRMGLSLREWGTSMTVEEVAHLVRRIDVPALLDYQRAVAERTVRVVSRLRPEELDAVPTEEHVRRVFFEEGVAGPRAGWLIDHYVGQSRGWHLFHCALTHNFYHLGQALMVRKLVGIDPTY